jgi:hypothetical protein
VKELNIVKHRSLPPRHGNNRGYCGNDIFTGSKSINQFLDSRRLCKKNEEFKNIHGVELKDIDTNMWTGKRLNKCFIEEQKKLEPRK